MPVNMTNTMHKQTKAKQFHSQKIIFMKSDFSVIMSIYVKVITHIECDGTNGFCK